MRLRIISIGKSKGIRLPAAVLKKYKIVDVLELIMEDDYFILKPKTEPRKNWDQLFLNAQTHKDPLLIPDVFEDENL
jgi:antitoxin MazE